MMTKPCRRWSRARKGWTYFEYVLKVRLRRSVHSVNVPKVLPIRLIYSGKITSAPAYRERNQATSLDADCRMANLERKAKW